MTQQKPFDRRRHLTWHEKQAAKRDWHERVEPMLASSLEKIGNATRKLNGQMACLALDTAALAHHLEEAMLADPEAYELPVLDLTRVVE